MTTRKFKILFISLFLLVMAGSAAVYLFRGDAFPGEEHVSAKVKEIDGYQKWTKVNSAPQSMPAEISALCAMPRFTPASNSVHGDKSQDKYFTVYVNGTGREAMLTQKVPQFPEGSVIVKEKLTDRNSKTPELLTVMIKQKKGSNPAAGDWEYMVTDGTGTKVEGRGMLENCQACHVGQQGGDYIFRTYLEEDTKKNLK
jgi:hypothetical protein